MTDHIPAEVDRSVAESSPALLYRFRPLAWLLEGGELANQEIYFASPAELNDPMEGFRDVFWSGDRIAWENLFRHYLRCLNWALMVYRLAGEEEQHLGWDNIPVVGPRPGEPGSASLEAMLGAVSAEFLEEPVVSRLIEFLAGRSMPVRRDELRGYMRSLHGLGLALMSRRHELNRLCPPDPRGGEMIARARSTLPNLDKMIGLLRGMSEGKQEDLMGEMFAVFNLLSGQMGMHALLEFEGDAYPANKDFLIRSFGEEFVDQLDKLLYPEWRAACFLTDAEDSSLWAAYGDNHRGACLIFKPSQEDGRATLPLTRVNGWGGGGATRGVVKHELHQVRYANRFPPVDFFRSIGTLPAGVLRERWHKDLQGRVSNCAIGSDDGWRAAYWRGFYEGTTTKLADWQREREFRLLLQGTLLDFTAPEHRKAIYDFKNLVGIVFGMKTPVASRLAMIRLVAEKCRAAGRADFKFYEARYSESKGRIVHVELGLIAGSIAKAAALASAASQPSDARPA